MLPESGRRTMLPESGRRAMLIAIREARTAQELWSVEITRDTAGDPGLNRLLLSGELDRVDRGRPVVFGTWRPPARLRRFGRARQPSVAPVSVPVLTPLRQAGRDAGRLLWRALRWVWRSLDPDGGG